MKLSHLLASRVASDGNLEAELEDDEYEAWTDPNYFEPFRVVFVVGDR